MENAMKNIVDCFTRRYPDESHYKIKKVQYTLIFSFFIASLATVLLVFTIFIPDSIWVDYFFVYLFYPVMIIVLWLIWKTRIVLAQNILLSYGFLTTIKYFSYNVFYHFYIQVLLVLFIGIIIYQIKSQLIFLYGLTNGLVIARAIFLAQYQSTSPVTENLFQQSVFVIFGTFALTLVASQIVKIIDAEIYESDLLKSIADLDPLTRLKNRDRFNKTLDTIYSKYEIVHLAIADIDFFKIINDTYGHAVGDQVLIQLARTIENHFSSDQFEVFRWGGEEFVICAYNVDILDFKEQLQSLIARVRAYDFGLYHAVTISIGLSSVNESNPVESLFILADQALYEAKQNGRDQLCVMEA